MRYILVIFTLLVSIEVYSKPTNWYNQSWNDADNKTWLLVIKEKDIPSDSLCSFGKRKFEPQVAIESAFLWLKSQDKLGYRVRELSIFPLGEQWQRCVYIVNLRNDSVRDTIRLGVDFDGKVYPPKVFP